MNVILKQEHCKHNVSIPQVLKMEYLTE
jgi:hypothetical protein